MMLLLPRYYKFASYASNSKNIFEFDEPVSISVLHHFLRKLHIFCTMFVRFSLFISYIAKSCKRECPILRKKSLNQVSSESTRPSSIFYTFIDDPGYLGTIAEISRSKRYSNETLGCASIECKGGWLPRCIVPYTANAFDADSILTCVHRYIIYKRKEISTLCSFVSLASDRINNTFQKYAPGSVYKTVTEIVY